MPSTARKIAISDTLVDINEATAQELRDALPGIGDILARRIVEYRNEHGPFEHPDDLMRVPGLNGKRLSKFAPRVSIAPMSGFRMPTPVVEAFNAPTASNDFVQPMPIFSIESDPLPAYNAPSMTSLMPNGPEESIGEPFTPSAFPSAQGQYVVGGSLLAGPRDSLAASAPPSLSRRPEPQQAAAEEEDMLGIPFHRPARVAVALAAIGLFSAILGATLGIQSQDGGPRTRAVEHRMGRVESNVNDLSGSVRSLEGQASAFASSINALDARIAARESPRSVERAPASAEKPTQVVEVAREPESRISAARRRVRQAMRELDPVAPASPRTP